MARPDRLHRLLERARRRQGPDKALNSVRVVNCDEVQLRILGLSLAGWDVVASAALAIYAGLAARLVR